MRILAAMLAPLALAGCAAATVQDKQFYDRSPTGKPEYARKGGYLGVGALQSMENFDTGGTGLSADDSNLGVVVRGGARLDENLAIELSLEDAFDYELSAGAASADLDIRSAAFQAKYYFLTDKVQPYALFGLGWAQADVSDIDVDDDGPFVRLGAGADMYLNPDVALFAELNYNRMGGDIDDLDHIDLLLGLLFRF